MADATMVRQQIETLDGRFSEAYSRGDVAALAAAYTEDAKLMPPDSDIVTGRQGIQQYFQGVRDMGVREAVLEPLEVQSEGNLAYEVGYVRLKIQTEGSEATTTSAKYLVVWKQQADGTWQMAVDIWNNIAAA